MNIRATLILCTCFLLVTPILISASPTSPEESKKIEEKIINQWIASKNQGVPKKFLALHEDVFPEGCELDDKMKALDPHSADSLGIPSLAHDDDPMGAGDLHLKSLRGLFRDGKNWLIADYEEPDKAAGMILRLYLKKRLGAELILENADLECTISLFSLGPGSPLFATTSSSRSGQIFSGGSIYLLNDRDKAVEKLQFGGWCGQMTCANFDKNGFHVVLDRIREDFPNDLKASLGSLASDANSNYWVFRYDIYEWKSSSFKLLCHYYELFPVF